MQEYGFVTLDVFTDRRFGGNQLAVFPAASGLSTEQMQQLAAEFNLSETTPHHRSGALCRCRAPWRAFPTPRGSEEIAMRQPRPPSYDQPWTPGHAASPSSNP
ncbi:hypothetical protein GA829_19600 [Mesorhizobium sp. INR15]|nr:hypothetical protein GA829_19600 [Mesorhizobium sp. INR15]